MQVGEIEYFRYYLNIICQLDAKEELVQCLGTSATGVVIHRPSK